MAPSSPVIDTRRSTERTPSRRKRRPKRPWTPTPPSPAQRKTRAISDIMASADYAVTKRVGDDDEEEEKEKYSEVVCEQCGSGERPDELLLCDKCDKGFHMNCLRPLVVRVPIGSWFCPKCSSVRHRRVRSFSQKKIIDFFSIQKFEEEDEADRIAQDARKRRRRPRSLVYQKKRRRLLPFIPSEDADRRLLYMRSLASALTASNIKYSEDLNYMPGMAPRAANRAKYESGGMQVLSKEDTETLELCRAMYRRGRYPPLLIVYDLHEGYTVEADAPIKDLTLIAEYTGDVDYMKTREHDDSDSMMTLLLATDSSRSLVICPDKRGNIARFINGINNHTLEGKKKQNCKCVRYNVNGECRVLLVATRDIAKGERLYYDYNGYEHEYPTHHFV